MPQDKASIDIDVKKSMLEFSNAKWHVPHMASILFKL